MLTTMIAGYIDSHHLDDAIEYIDTSRRGITVKELNEALKRYGENPRKYRYKDEKISALINVLRNYEY